MPFLLAIPLMVRTLSGGQTRLRLWHHNLNCGLTATPAQSRSTLLLHARRLRDARNSPYPAPATNFISICFCSINSSWLKTSEPSKRAFATSGRRTTLPSANTSRNASRDIATFSRLVKTFSLRATADLYSCRNSAREIRADFGVTGRFIASRSFANSA